MKTMFYFKCIYVINVSTNTIVHAYMYTMYVLLRNTMNYKYITVIKI